jgi:hypothetical protein
MEFTNPCKCSICKGFLQLHEGRILEKIENIRIVAGTIRNKTRAAG